MPISPEIFDLLSNEEITDFGELQHMSFQAVSNHNTETIAAAELNLINLFIILICLMQKYENDIEGGAVLIAHLELMLEEYCRVCKTLQQMHTLSYLPSPKAGITALNHLLTWHTTLVDRHLTIQAVLREKKIAVNLDSLLPPLHHLAKQAHCFQKLASAPWTLMLCIINAKNDQPIKKLPIDTINQVLSFLWGRGYLRSNKQDMPHNKPTLPTPNH